MARPALSRAPGALLLQKVEAGELEVFSGSPIKPTPERVLSQMYPEENRMGAMAVNYLDGFDYSTPVPFYNGPGLSYYSSPPDVHGTVPSTGLQPLGSVASSPLMFRSPSPQLSPFIPHSHQPAQQVPFYLENASTPVFRNTGGKRESAREHLCAAPDRQPPTGAFEKPKETRYCAVCSDYASGYHYGVWSCEGCKAFFKRSIQGHNDYMCPATNQCTIDKNRRKSCQACRLRRCYEVGMMRGGLRKERGGHRLPREKRTRPKSEKGSPGEKGSRGEEEAPLSTGGHVLAMPVEQVLLQLLDAEPPVLCSKQKHSSPYTEVTMMTLLTNLADKELVHMIAWAKKLPGFLELSLHIQVQLLESSWLEVLMIGLIWRSVSFPGKLIFAQDLVLDRSEGGCVEGMAEIFDMLLATVSRFRALKLKSEEFVCLKAIILLNSGAIAFCPGSVEKLSGGPSVQNTLDKITDALVHVIAKSGVGVQQQSRRQAQLLLLLSHIRHMSNKGMEHLYSVKCKNMVPLYDLLLEMLDAHRLHSPVKTQAETGPSPANGSTQSGISAPS